MRITKTVLLVEVDCCVCGIDFAVPDWMDKQRRDDGQMWHCPLGHGQSYSESESARLRKRVSELQARNVHLLDQQRAVENTLRTVERKLTKERKRVGNGVCPCCNRTFQNVSRHMASQHPGFKDQSALEEHT